MQCVAGDGIGILVAAAVLSPLQLPEWVNLLAEYGLRFLFGWTIFQALFMRGMVDGSYSLSLRKTFLPEFVSMNGLMAGMVALSGPWRQAAGTLAIPTHPAFWFILSMSLTLGFCALNHDGNAHSQGASGHGASSEGHHARPVSSTAKARRIDKALMILVSLILISIGVAIAGTLGSLTGN